ncbi:MAG: helix-turn-helix transcriptional regulator [Pseudobdellovibrionaceae bacterium]
MITSKQCRAARALLAWSQPDLAQKCGIHVQTISNFEHETSTPTQRTLSKIAQVMELNGIEFIEDGVREVRNLTILSGTEGFQAFLDDVYQTAMLYGTEKKPCEIYLSNVTHGNWIKWAGEEKWAQHVNRMIKDKGVMDVRIIVREKDFNFPARAYAQYKWFPKRLFNDKSFYAYHDKLAFLDFQQDEVHITIMRHTDFAEGYRTLFNIAWDHVAQIPA